MDLDALLPEPIKVKISGKVVDLYPGKLKILARIQNVGKDIMGGDGSKDQLAEVLDLLSQIIPAIKEDEDLDISPLQIQKIIEVAYNAQVPTDSKELKTAKMNPSDKKKEERT